MPYHSSSVPTNIQNSVVESDVAEHNKAITLFRKGQRELLKKKEKQRITTKMSTRFQYDVLRQFLVLLLVT